MMTTVTHFSFKDKHRPKAKEWQKIFHISRKEKRRDVAIHISDKIDFKSKTVTRDKDDHYTIVKQSIH